jgi:hypothetical protein
MTTETSDLLLPGYWVDEDSGAWCTLPWPTNPEEKVALARSSLGPQIIDWSEGRTDEPGLWHYMHRTPWQWTAGQKRFLILWYSLDGDGRFRFRSGVKRGAKGTGKDPMLAAMCNAELLGPVEPHDRDDRTGLWVGHPRGFPLVQVMSNSEDQSKKVLRIANGMWTQDAREHYDLDPGETRTIIKGTGARFEVPTAAEESSEGDPVTFAGINESHHMTPQNGGNENAAVIRRNVAKSPTSVQARALEFTNAHRQGGRSVAEESFLAWQHQLTTSYRGKRDILYDSIEAPPGTDILTEEGRLRGLTAAYLDAPWNDKQRISDEMADRRTTVADQIRFYLNGLGAEEDSWIDPSNFDALIGAGVVADGEQVALFVDCSKSGDATAATATRLSDLFTFEIGCWEKPPGWRRQNGPWRAPRSEVDATIRAAWDKYDVVWIGVDPSPALDDEDDALYWRATVDGWRRDFGPELKVWATPGAQGDPVRFDMRLSQPGGRQRNQQFTETAEWLALEVDGDDGNGHTGTTWRHDGSSRLRLHAHNARRRPNLWGVSLGKVTRDSSKYVDLAVCMVGSVMGARLALNSGKLDQGKKRTNKAVFF